MSIAAVEPGEGHDAIDGVPPPAATFRLHGHDGPWRELGEALAGGRLHHAWLMQGPRGIGKATAAFAFARRLMGCAPAPGANPDDPDVSPDDPTARQIAQGSHPNLVHLTRPLAERGGGFRSQITVEEIRKLNRFFHTTTGSGGWRVAIVDPADDMNRNAANALLKILEEPPERSIFLITNHLPGRLLPTIRSRCRVLRFEPLAPGVLRQTLNGLQVEFGTAEVEQAIGLAEGSVRSALSLMSGGGIEIEARLEDIWTGDEIDWNALHGLADALTQKGRESAFDLLIASLFNRLAAESRHRLAAGDLGGARSLADYWAAESVRFREGLAFNLDRKQLVLTFFQGLSALRHPRLAG